MKKAIVLPESIEYVVLELEENGRYKMMREYRQHGSASLHEHCIRVAILSSKIARCLHLNVDTDSLIRGALLHDYYLYDWHDQKHRHQHHASRHPNAALKNAELDYAINEIERDIIVHHMFPLTHTPPKTLEGWIVCMADTLSAISETIMPHRSVNIA